MAIGRMEIICISPQNRSRLRNVYVVQEQSWRRRRGDLCASALEWEKGEEKREIFCLKADKPHTQSPLYYTNRGMQKIQRAEKFPPAFDTHTHLHTHAHVSC